MLYFYFYIKNVGCRRTNSGRYPNIYYRTKKYNFKKFNDF